MENKKFWNSIESLLRYRNFKIWHPLKQTKSKNGRHFFISTFENLQLCFFVQKDSSTLKVLKMQFVFGWAIIRNIADWICNVPYRRLSQRQIAFLGPLEWMNHFGQKSKVVSFQKLMLRSVVRFLILFVLMDAIFLNCDISVGRRWNFKFWPLGFVKFCDLENGIRLNKQKQKTDATSLYQLLITSNFAFLSKKIPSL